MLGLVSVVIPVYNGCTYLPQAVECVLRQTHANVEIVAIDDGSTDNSAAILTGYGEKVRVFRQENCGNVGQVRNAGIERGRVNSSRFSTRTIGGGRKNLSGKLR